mmetsp:Transcript_365/g.408  ORF Transcript_365/g.408 Transcript_365/m.408 type:complete len:225 (+) Transcript_365:116-790(+)|eukprot:CAMPEP_0195264486 /NCGR_PEP_ID=MMETSP0706-20130129/10886_1 /TAXON_ID=33640 /ORGANISM="Asterionellopsis glacialis, Strain CCMP134" /LENGTH=224 /DNA_ID=CAMNT_0040318781 /DNA_START=97 /DNA_END=771 /DNA_ORIENTATION=+
MYYSFISVSIFLLAMLSHHPRLLVAGEDQEASSSSAVRSSMRGPKGAAKKKKTWRRGGSKTVFEEKGVKCKGHFDGAKQGGRKSCKGGIKAEFSRSSKATDIMDYVATGIHQQVSDAIIPPSTEIMIDDVVSEDMMNTMMAFDDDDDDTTFTLCDNDGLMTEGCSKTFKFGGYMKARWGCTVTFEMKDGKFIKKTECGVEGIKGMGKAPKDDEEDDDEIFTMEM